MILSIDVGIKNLAMCLLDEDKDNLVVEWDVDGIPPQHKDGVYVSMRDHLDARPWVLKAKPFSSRSNLTAIRRWFRSCTSFMHTSSSGVPKLKLFSTMLVTRFQMLLDLVRHSTIRERRFPSRGANPLSVATR